MKIAVISDIHDRIDHLELVIEKIVESGCIRILCLGDISSPFALNALISQTPTIPIDMVYGNNDFDIGDFEKISLAHPRLVIHGISADLSFGGFRIAITHLPGIAKNMAESGNYDFVFYGHTHAARIETIGKCTLANPGEIMGRTGQIGYGILDTKSGQFTLHSIAV